MREAAEVTSDNFWLFGCSLPWLFWLPALLDFWLLVFAVLKETADTGDANMSAVSLTGELTGERNWSAMAGSVCSLQHGFMYGKRKTQHHSHQTHDMTKFTQHNMTTSDTCSLYTGIIYMYHVLSSVQPGNKTILYYFSFIVDCSSILLIHFRG